MYGGGQQAGGLVLVYNVAIAPTELLAQGGNLPSGFSEADLASMFSAYSSAHSFRLLEDFSLAAVSFSSFEEMHHAQASLDSRVTYGRKPKKKKNFTHFYILTCSSLSSWMKDMDQLHWLYVWLHQRK